MKENVEGSKTVNRSTTESISPSGPVYSCTTGECATNPFTTDKKEDFEKHLQESNRHYQQGAAPCAICGQEVNMNEVLTRAGHKPIHDKCIPEREEL